MTLILLYLLGALGVSFLCSVLEAVLLSTPVSFISMKESQGIKAASLLMKYKTNIDRPVAAILTLNTVAHTIGAAGVGSESVKVFGEACFGIISAILTLLILVLSENHPEDNRRIILADSRNAIGKDYQSPDSHSISIGVALGIAHPLRFA